MRRRIDGHGLGRGFLFRGLEPAWVVLILPYYAYLITGWEICDVQPESRRLPVVDD